MRILILGYSKIVRKRVIPAIGRIADITKVDVASRSSASQILLPETIKGDIFDDYEQALSKSTADIVYISTVNSTHAEWAEKAFLEGFHVVVDKPAFTKLEDAERMVDLANRQKRCLAEATVYAYHPQIALAKDVFLSAKVKPTRLTAIFSFPPLNADNFRYIKALGGGALQDLGPYAVTPGRLFFEEEPKEICCRVGSRGGKDNIETSFSMLAVYSEGKSMVGHFGFDTEYRNFMNVLGPDISIENNRIFTISPEMENELQIKQGNKRKALKTPKADCFALFLTKVLDDIKRGDYKEFLDSLYSDALVFDRLRLAALKG